MRGWQLVASLLAPPLQYVFVRCIKKPTNRIQSSKEEGFSTGYNEGGRESTGAVDEKCHEQVIQSNSNSALSLRKKIPSNAVTITLKRAFEKAAKGALSECAVIRPYEYQFNCSCVGDADREWYRQVAARRMPMFE